MKGFTRIVHDPAIMGGKPTIRGTRVTVGALIGQLASGRSIETLLADYPYVTREDVLEAMRYAAWLAEGHDIALQAVP